MKTVDVIIPTLKRIHAFNAFKSLNFIPWPIKLYVITEGNTWAEAINIGLSKTSGFNDVIIMDDDIVLNQSTFSLLDTFYSKGDIFGFKLLFPDGTIQHAGGIVLTDNNTITHYGYHQNSNESEFTKPYYTCHVTTSLVYIKRDVFHKVGWFAEDIPGVQMEDVDFNFRAIKAGLKPLYLPGEAVHLESATKKIYPGFYERLNQAYQEVSRRHFSDIEFLKKVKSYPKQLEFSDQLVVSV